MPIPLPPTSPHAYGPHPAPGAWAAAGRLTTARHIGRMYRRTAVSVLLLSFLCILGVAIGAAFYAGRVPPMPPPSALTQADLARARGERERAQRARARRGAFFAHNLPRHPEMRAQAEREGFLYQPPPAVPR